MPDNFATVPVGSQAPPEKQRGRDPHLGLRFWVEIDGIEVAGFTECSGLKMETEVFEYSEGGLNTYTHKLPVRTKYGNITLKRGLNEGQDLYHWYRRTMDGKTNRRDAGGKPKGKNLSIIVYGPYGDTPVERWDLRGAYPVKWTGPDLKTERGAVAIETLEIAHEGLI
jgi:phage tail-like protein